MAISTRHASWEIPPDRKAAAVWLGIFWIGILIGFGVDFPEFLRQQPAPPGIVYLHAVVFVGWLVLVTAQVALVLSGRLSLHRQIGRFGTYIAGLMVLLGLATALTVIGRYHFPPESLALNLVDLLGLFVFVALGIHYRTNPAVHKRMMMLAMVSITDPGYSRAIEYIYPDLKTPLDWFLGTFYANVLLVALMFGWDLFRRRRVHPALLIGGTALLAAELVTAFLNFSPAWNAVAGSIVHAWGYTGGTP